MTDYVGRFAPSPTGPLHAGSLVTAIASWLDARAHAGTWLLRIEDLDPPREQPGGAARIVESLARLGLESDRPVLYQSDRHAHYRSALEQLSAAGLAYPCGCTRREIPDLIYPGTCRSGLAPGRVARAWRVRVPDNSCIRVEDRACGIHSQCVNREVGDFVLLRADGYWAYQLAVVVDDAAQGVTDIVRGEDLLDSTARQRVLQRLLGLPSPRTLHVPVVRNAEGEKLSKQTGAPAIEGKPGPELIHAALAHLGLACSPRLGVQQQLDEAIGAWRERFGLGRLATAEQGSQGT